MRRQIAFILSTNYAGSHFASLMIGSHTAAVHAGEVCRLRKESLNKVICARCGSAAACPLFREIHPETIDRAFDLLFAAVAVIAGCPCAADLGGNAVGCPGLPTNVTACPSTDGDGDGCVSSLELEHLLANIFRCGS